MYTYFFWMFYPKLPGKLIHFQVNQEEIGFFTQFRFIFPILLANLSSFVSEDPLVIVTTATLQRLCIFAATTKVLLVLLGTTAWCRLAELNLKSEKPAADPSPPQGPLGLY
jgi:hypothetical protein